MFSIPSIQSKASIKDTGDNRCRGNAMETIDRNALWITVAVGYSWVYLVVAERFSTTL